MYCWYWDDDRSVRRLESAIYTVYLVPCNVSPCSYVTVVMAIFITNAVCCTVCSVAVGYVYKDCVTQPYWEVQSAKIAGNDMMSSEIGGWNVDVHHVYSVQEGIPPHHHHQYYHHHHPTTCLLQAEFRCITGD